MVWRPHVVIVHPFPGSLSQGELQLAGAFFLTLICAFGAIHVAAWSFLFPSTLHQSLWRVASLLTMTLPLAPFLIGFSFMLMDEQFNFSYSTYNWVPFSCLSLCLSTYVFARCVLLVQMLVLLVGAPPEIYRSLNAGVSACLRYDESYEITEDRYMM